VSPPRISPGTTSSSAARIMSVERIQKRSIGNRCGWLTRAGRGSWTGIYPPHRAPARIRHAFIYNRSLVRAARSTERDGNDAMSKGKLAVLAIIAVLVVAFLWFDLGRYLDLQYLKSRQADIDAFYRENPLLVLAAYFAAYVAITGLSLPGAAIMTLAAGAVFGLLWGTVLVSFASTLGATVAFIVSRYILRDGIQRRYGDRLKAINAGIERDGAFYLFTLRLVPAFPFFVINLVMGLTPMRTLTFALVSQVGMLPGTIVYVNAGTQLARIESLQGILSPALIGSFVLLGVFPLIAKWIVGAVKARRDARRGGGTRSVSAPSSSGNDPL